MFYNFAAWTWEREFRENDKKNTANLKTYFLKKGGINKQKDLFLNEQDCDKKKK